MITENATIAPANRGMAAGVSTNQRFAAPDETRVEFPREKCIPQFFEEQVRRTPGRTALIFGRERMSYEELNRRADSIAATLRALGITQDVPVGICVRRSFDMMVGLLGILKAGGCYLPLDPMYPQERLGFVLEDARPPVLLTQGSLRDRLALASNSAKVICLDEQQGGNQHAEEDTHQNSNSLAYLIYTSGSTGRPKGVMISHRNVANFFAGMDRVLGTDPGVWLAVTSISFDISVLELFWTLARGFTVVIVPDGPPPTNLTRKTKEQAMEVGILDLIRQHGVTHFQCTPSLAGSLVRHGGSDKAWRQLTKCLIGGEALPSSLAIQLRRELNGDLLNMYGPTETTIWSATHLVRDVEGLVPIGRPIANTQIHILDAQCAPVPEGEAGELFIGGEGVARGYWNRPELTAEKFVPDPFSCADDARLYRTGDIGRVREDGSLEFLGRADHQIKLHGHRIELGEIEWALSQHPAVQECVVHIWEAGPNDKRLSAYLVKNRAGPLSVDTAELRRFLEATLPQYMIPAAFVWLEKLPLTPNGKVDRKALPEPAGTRPNVTAPYTAPAPGLQQTIADIWREALRIDKVGAHDNFFDLGGNSLLLMQIHSRLCMALKEDVPIVRFFEHPTIAALTAFLASCEKSSLQTINERAARQRAAFKQRQPQAVGV